MSRVPSIHEIRDADEARNLLRQAVWLQRVASVSASSVDDALRWGMEILSAGEPLPPLGFVADIGHLVLGRDETESARRVAVDIPDWPAAEFRIYDDYVLGKLYADTSFERAADAVAHYSAEADRVKSLAFLINQFRARAGVGGFVFSPGVIKQLQQTESAKILEEGWVSLTANGPHPLLRELYAELIAGVRNTGSVLSGADVFELEHGTALAEFSQRIALRQVVDAADELAAALPRQPVRNAARRQQVATRMLDEDLYPIGGFTSISNKGTVESLLHSQLAYMEPAGAERPDLFDIKFLRDELLYYARDENQFFRRRRTFVLALYPDLVAARVKDRDLPAQRIVLLLATIVTMVRKLVDWLNDDSLLFEIVLVRGAVTPQEFSAGRSRMKPTSIPAPSSTQSAKTGGSDIDREQGPGEGATASPLVDERELLAMLLREQIDNGTVAIAELKASHLGDLCRDHAWRSLCQCLLFSTRPRALEIDEVEVFQYVVGSSTPRLAGLEIQEAETSRETWTTTLRGVLDALL